MANKILLESIENQKIISKNVAIAEYINMDKDYHPTHGYKQYLYNGYWHSIKNLKFDKDWNWLMFAVKNIHGKLNLRSEYLNEKATAIHISDKEYSELISLNLFFNHLKIGLFGGDLDYLFNKISKFVLCQLNNIKYE
jgi:hypothetical protein